MSFPSLTRFLLAAACAVLLAACVGMTPEPLTRTESAEATEAVLARVAKEREPIPAAVTLEWAMARAMRLNLDRRVRMMEASVALGQFDTSRFDMLPRLATEAGYYWRSNDPITRPRDSVTGRPSLANPQISSEREHFAASSGPTWSVLDFGTSYFTAKQLGDKTLIALERRRKAMHQMMMQVQSAFWKVAVAQRLGAEVAETVRLAEASLEEARVAERERLRSPVDSLRAQKTLLESVRTLEAVQRELAAAQVELADLLNAPQGTSLVVVEPVFRPEIGLVGVDVAELEEVALGHNADVTEAHYNARIAAQESRKAITRLFPNLSFDYKARYDDDSYLKYDNWQTAGATITFNLFNLVTLPRDLRLIEASEELAERRRMSALMAVVAQVHLARLEYGTALQSYHRAEEMAGVDQRLLTHVERQLQAEFQSRTELVAARTNAILGLQRRYQAIVALQMATGRLQSTLGLDPVAGPVDTLATDELAARLRTYLTSWEGDGWRDLLDH